MAATIHSDRRAADRRLREYFDCTREPLIEVVKAAVAARAGCTENDAKAAPGFYAWNGATARSRQIFRAEGWDKGDLNGVETILHEQLRVMIAVMNTDSGTCDRFRSPRNRTHKGPAAERIVDLNNQHELFPTSALAPKAESPYSLWYLCIHDDGQAVRAELSKPSEYLGGYVVKYSERIFILEDGDWEKIVVEPGAGDQGQDFDIEVRRRS